MNIKKLMNEHINAIKSALKGVSDFVEQDLDYIESSTNDLVYSISNRSYKAALENVVYIHSLLDGIYLELLSHVQWPNKINAMPELVKVSIKAKDDIVTYVADELQAAAAHSHIQ